MSYSNNIYAIAKSKLDDRRQSAYTTATKNQREVYSKIPRLQQIDFELSSIGSATAIAVVSAKDVSDQLNSYKEKSLSLQNEYKSLLSSHGYPDDYTQVKYHCIRCNDTGFVEEDNKTVMCDCFTKLLKDTACEELNKISPLSLSTFDTFDLGLYNDCLDENGKNPYTRMCKIYDFCLDYTHGFSSKSRGILMRGNTGLGKTHLSLAIANELINKGYSVVYVSAPNILSKLEREHFSYDYNKENETMQLLLDCDLLIIDDLGTEFSTQFSSTAIYNIFNSRISAAKPIIINTNMTVSEMQDAYSQRFVSRVMGYCDKLDFIGKDIRAVR